LRGNRRRSQSFRDRREITLSMCPPCARGIWLLLMWVSAVWITSSSHSALNSIHAARGRPVPRHNARIGKRRSSDPLSTRWAAPPCSWDLRRARPLWLYGNVGSTSALFFFILMIATSQASSRMHAEHRSGLRPLRWIFAEDPDLLDRRTEGRQEGRACPLSP